MERSNRYNVERMSSQATVFDKILSGEIPCHRVYEDASVLAFLDINPIAPGHTLVIPNQRKAFLHELDDEFAAAIGRVLPRIARAAMAASGATEYNILQNNGRGAHQAVFHVHFHVIPKVGGHGLGIEWRPGGLSSEQAQEYLERMHASIAGA
jgi:histidine triad (HIT) family protein